MTKKDLLRVKKRIVVSAIAAVTSFSLSGCSNQKDNKTTDTNNIETTAEAPETTTSDIETTIEAISEETTTEQVTEAETEEVVEETESSDYIPGELDINNNSSIEEVVNNSYEKYKEFYDLNGIDKDQIRDIVFFINDKYEDEDGNLTIKSLDNLKLAYCNVERILYPYHISKKINNIDHIELGDITPEDDEIIVPEIARLSDFIDKNLSGGPIIAEQTIEWEDELDYQRNLMNQERRYDVEHINKFIDQNEEGDYNAGKVGLSNTTLIGFNDLITYQHKYALFFAGAVQPDVNYIDSSTGKTQFKINPFNSERKIEGIIETLQDEVNNKDSVLYGYDINKITEDVITSYNGDIAPEAEEIAAEYGLSIENSNIIIDYAVYLQTMSYYQYENIGCSDKKKAVDKYNEIVNRKTSSIKNDKVRNLVLC